MTSEKPELSRCAVQLAQLSFCLEATSTNATRGWKMTIHVRRLAKRPLATASLVLRYHEPLGWGLAIESRERASITRGSVTRSLFKMR